MTVDPKSLCECGHPRNHHQFHPDFGYWCVTCRENGLNCTKDPTS